MCTDLPVHHKQLLHWLIIQCTLQSRKRGTIRHLTEVEEAQGGPPICIYQSYYANCKKKKKAVANNRVTHQVFIS